MLPFGRDAFFSVFGSYNVAIWPAQLLAYGLGLPILAAVVHPQRTHNRLAAASLVIMWLFTGIGYHWLAFAPINPVAQLFGAVFLLQALLLAVAGWTGCLTFGRQLDRQTAYAGAGLIAYAAVLYPLIGLVLEGYPRVPLFGVTPCPVTIFTLGCLLLAQSAPWWLFPLPVLWSFIGGSAASLLGVPQDWPLLASGVLALALLAVRRRSVPA